MTRGDIKQYLIYHTNGTSTTIEAKSFTRGKYGLLFWDTTGNIEIGFVPYSNFLMIKAVEDTAQDGGIMRDNPSWLGE